MNEPKAANAPVDAERVVRELLDAFKSLQTRPPLTHSSPGEEVQRPDEAEPEQISAFESAENPETLAQHIGGQSGHYEIIEAFCRNHGIIERIRVTPQELQALSDASLLGSLACTQDLLFMLRKIREAGALAEPGPVVGLEQIPVRHPSGASSFERATDRPSYQRNENKLDSTNQPEHGERREWQGSEPDRNESKATAALGLSIASLSLSLLILAVLYRTRGAYRRYATTVSRQAAIIGKQREITEKTLSAIQAQATAAQLASRAAKAQADRSKIQAEDAALSARTARDILRIAEAPDVNLEAITCSPPSALSLDTMFTLRFRNSGRTRADNFESVFFVGIPTTPSTEEPTASAGDVSAASVSAGASKSSESTGTVGDIFSRNPGSVPPEQTFQKIVASQLKFGIWGYVLYTDVLREKHRKNFEYFWDSNFPNACLFTAGRTSAE